MHRIKNLYALNFKLTPSTFFQLAVIFIVSISTAVTGFNRFFNRYFSNRSFPVQILLLAVGTVLLVLIIGSAWFFYLRESKVRPFNNAYLLISLLITIIWVALPYAAPFNRGLILTPVPWAVSDQAMRPVFVCFLRVLEIIPLIVFFSLKLDRRFFYIGLCIYSVAVLITVVRAPVVRRGDAFEYLYMAQAVQNHLSPNITNLDIASLEHALSQNDIPTPQHPYSGFFPTSSGLQFSYHFWLYPLIVVPAKILLEGMGFNGLLAFQLTNALLFLVSIWSVGSLALLDQERKIALTAFFCINPALWYLQWWSPEIFSYSFAILSLVFGTRKQYHVAALFAAIAATQNPPLLFLAGYFVIFGVFTGWQKKPREQLIHLVKSGVSIFPAFLPYIFFLYFYQVPSLILGNESGWKLIHFQKFLDFFLDWNMGILPYMPILLFLFIFLIGQDILRRSYRNFIFAITILVSVLSTTQTHNWNSDCNGLMRYAVWMTPLIAFYIIQNIKMSWIWRSAWWGSMAFQLITIASFGGMVANISYTHMTPMAVLILDHYPQLYSPNQETFIERTHHAEIPANFSLYRSGNGSVRKILADEERFKQFIDLKNIAYEVNDPSILDQAAADLRNTDGLHYLNFSDQALRITNLDALNELGNQ